MNTQEIEQAVNDLLATCNVAFGTRYVGERPSVWGKHNVDVWHVNFNSFESEFFMGLGHRKPVRGAPERPKSWSGRKSIAQDDWDKLYLKPTPPTAASVLHSLIADSTAARMSFNDWCDDYGFDTDSRKAMKTYIECQETDTNLRKVFTRAQLAALADTVQGY